MQLRNILITVMMLAVVAFLFINTIMGTDGIREGISDQGVTAKQEIEKLSPLGE